MHVPTLVTRHRWNGLVLRALAVLVTLCACENLPLIRPNRCGNRVVEAGEECDDFPSDWCQPPGSENAGTINCRRHPCPEGAGCGADALCRTPSSTALNADTFAAGEAGARLHVGDMDGDLRQDLLVHGNSRSVHARFGADRALVSALNIALASDDLTIGSLNGDARDDLVGFDQRAGELAVLQADATGELTPVSHIRAAPGGKAQRMLAVDSNGDGRAEPFLLVDDSVYAVPSRSTDSFEVVLSGAVAAGDVAGHIATGNFAGSEPTATGSEFALGALGAPRVHVYTLRNQFGAKELATVELPAGQKVGARGLFAGDHNADGKLDLFASSGSAAAGLYVAYGVGDGSFHSRPTLPSSHGDNRFAPAAVALGLFARVLTVADLDGDQRADLVLESDASLNGEHGFACAAEEGCGHPHEPWAAAVAADFNRDGYIDVIGTPLDTRELSYWLGLGDGSFNTFAIATHGIPAPTRGARGAQPALAVGDFDGDLAQDLAFAETEGGTVDQDDLTVLFGKPLGVPSELRQVGRVDRAKELCAGILFPAANTVTDLVLLAEDDGAVGVGTFKGETSRLMFSPLGVPVDAQHQRIALQDVFLGRFRPKPAPHAPDVRARDDLVMYANTTAQGLFFYFMANGAQGFENTNLSQEPAHLPTGTMLDHLGFAVTDVDADDVDELLIMPDRMVRGRFRYWVARREESSFRYPAFADALRGAPQNALTLRFSSHPMPDVDGNGRSDVTARAGLEGKPSTHAVVVFNNSKGRLSDGAVFTLPAHDFAAYLNVDGDGALELAVAGNKTQHIQVYDLDFATTQATLLFTRETAGPIGDLVAGDFDGNGVTDLAASTDRVEIFWGEAEEP